jgi:hypothetical protein
LITKSSNSFRSHPDHFLFESLPGAGKQLSPRLLAVFGSDRARWAAPMDIQKFSGIAPVMNAAENQSGFIAR